MPHAPGRQVWNKQRKDEILLDVNDVAASLETRMRWNEAGSWVWSDAIVHEPLISAGDFEAAQAIMADAGRARRTSREAHQRGHSPVRPARAAVLRVLRPPDARPPARAARPQKIKGISIFVDCWYSG